MLNYEQANVSLYQSDYGRPRRVLAGTRYVEPNNYTQGRRSPQCQFCFSNRTDRHLFLGPCTVPLEDYYDNVPQSLREMTNDLKLIESERNLNAMTALRCTECGVWNAYQRFKWEDFELVAQVVVEEKVSDTFSFSARGQLGTIVVDITYGGRAITRKLKLLRVPIDEGAREWILDPSEVDRMFDDRLIRRSDAARLENPRKSKR